MHIYVENKRWHTSVGLAFWGSLVQILFSLIGTIGLMYLAYNLCDILLSVLPYSSTKDFIHFDKVKNGVLDSIIGCLIIATLGYLTYMIGICMWRGAQTSGNSKERVRNLILAELIMPIEAIILFVMYYTSSPISDSSLPIVLLVCWGVSVGAVIIALIQFNSLSKEETWIATARKGAEALKTSYVFLLWILVALIIGFGLICLAIYSSLVRIDAIMSGSYEMNSGLVQEIKSIPQEVQNFVDSIHLTLVLMFLVVLVFAILLAVYRIIGWYRIINGGNEEDCHVTLNQNACTVTAHFCSRCGKQLPEKSVFCPSCGTRVTFGVRNGVEEGAKWKKWLLWGGVALGIIGSAIFVWYVLGRTGKIEANAIVFAERSVIFKNVEDGIGVEPIDELKYNTQVEWSISDLKKDDSWTKVAFEKEGEVIKGYMLKADLIPSEDFLLLKNAGMADTDARTYLPSTIDRLALLHALKRSGAEWELEIVNRYGQRQPNSNRLYIRDVSPSEECLGFILRRGDTGERKFFLYSTPDQQIDGMPVEPVFLYSESVKEGDDMIYDVTFDKKEKKYVVTFTKASNVSQDYEEFVEDSEFAKERRFDGTIEMSGYIDGKYAVKMEMTEHADGSLSGHYIYVKNGVPIVITGTYIDNGDRQDISLEEFVDGKITGNFIGCYDGVVFSGSWVSPDGSKEMPFRLER